MKQSDSSRKSKESNADTGKYFDTLREENFDETFPATETWLRNINTNLSTKKSERKFSNMKNYLAANKFKLVYTFLILAFIVAACNYPVTQEESAGDVMMWTISNDNIEAQKKIEYLDWFKNGEYNINEENADGKGFITYSVIIPKQYHSKVAGYEKQLSEIPGILQVKLSPLSETVKRPVYSAVLNNLFKIDINATNLSDGELSKEIDSQLKNAGIQNANIDFEKDDKGQRRVKIFIPDSEMKKDGGFDMTIKDGKNVTKLKEVRKEGPGDAIKFKGKTDDEIRKMVREDLGLMDLTDDQIQIVREGDAVKVMIKKSDVKGDMKWEIEDKVK